MSTERCLSGVLLLLLMLSPSVGQTADLRVISLNLWKSGTEGFHHRTRKLIKNRDIALAGIERYLKKQVGKRAAMIALQEVDDGTRRSKGEDVAQRIDDYLSPGWVNRFGPLMTFDGGEYGNAVLASGHTKVSYTQYWRFAHDPNNPDEYGKEPRGAVAVKARVAGRQIWFVSVHLDPPNAIALRQMWQLMGQLKTLDPSVPVVVAGDFNIGAPNEKSYQILAHVFDSERSGFKDLCPGRATSIKAPRMKAEKQIDYVFMYDPTGAIKSTCRADWVFKRPYVFSDHKALVVDIDFD